MNTMHESTPRLHVAFEPQNSIPWCCPEAAIYLYPCAPTREPCTKLGALEPSATCQAPVLAACDEDEEQEDEEEEDGEALLFAIDAATLAAPFLGEDIPREAFVAWGAMSDRDILRTIDEEARRLIARAKLDDQAGAEGVDPAYADVFYRTLLSAVEEELRADIYAAQADMDESEDDA